MGHLIPNGSGYYQIIGCADFAGLDQYAGDADNSEADPRQAAVELP
jgi:hypothetical protein